MTQTKWHSDQIQDQTDRVIVITGATSGIGKETAKVLACKNATVIIGARNVTKAEGAIADIKQSYPRAKVSFRPLDLTNLNSINAFANSILTDFERIDVLINNAGIMACPYATTEDGFEMQFGTNHLGHFALTGLLLPLLGQTKDARIVVLSSIAHKFSKIDSQDLNWQRRKYNTNRAYSDSKMANLLFMRELVNRVQTLPHPPKVTAAHPGWTRTELQRHAGLVRLFNPLFSQGVEQGALPTLRAGFDPDAQSGDFYGPSKFFELHGDPVKVKSNKLSHNKRLAQDVWQRSEQLTQVYY